MKKTLTLLFSNPIHVLLLISPDAGSTFARISGMSVALFNRASSFSVTASDNFSLIYKNLFVNYNNQNRFTFSVLQTSLPAGSICPVQVPSKRTTIIT
ncbi:MAG: hypothetical protein PHT07_14115 [Paludibacter sp.]|nr:hypothetical protein [Paludibacter sp.]